MWLFQRESIQLDVFWQRRLSKMSYTLKNICLSFKRLTNVERSQNVMYKCWSLDRIKISSIYTEKSWKSNNPLDIGLVSWYQVSTSSFWMFTETFFQEKGTFYLLLNLYLGLEYDLIVWIADLPRDITHIVKLALSAPSHTSFQCGAYSQEILPLASFVTAWGPNHRWGNGTWHMYVGIRLIWEVQMNLLGLKPAHRLVTWLN